MSTIDSLTSLPVVFVVEDEMTAPTIRPASTSAAVAVVSS
jgi:hypothetical protein